MNDKAQISCHVQHMGKGSPDSIYASDMERFLVFKKSTIIAEIQTLEPPFLLNSATPNCGDKI
jgi:hypothetical protein